jgi:hypothetical protein
MNYKLDFKFNTRRIIAALLLIIAVIPLVINRHHNSMLNEWRTRYNIDDQHIFTQELKNGVASFICYMLIQTGPEQVEVQTDLDDHEIVSPTEQEFNDQLQSILNHYQTYPNDFKLALIKLYKNSYTLSQKSGSVDKQVWKKSLSQYYNLIYTMLDTTNKTFAYGPLQGKILPAP